jgi:hypothetical protein
MTETGLTTRSVDQIEKDKEVKTLVQGAMAMMAAIGAHEITDKASSDEANKRLLDAQQIMKTIEARRKFFVEPYKAVAKAIDNIFNRTYDPLDAAVRTLRTKMGDYAMKVEREAKPKRDAIIKKEAEGKIKPETAVKQMAKVETIAPVARTDAGSISYRTDVKLRITDETKLPREYLVPDERMILMALKGGKKVAGAELYEVKVPVGRGF